MLTVPSLATAPFQQQAELDSMQLKAIAQGTAGTGVLSGGVVTWNTAMTMAITATTYCQSGIYHSNSAVGATSSVSSDPSNPVWYILYIDTSQVYQLIRGTPAAEPELPVLPDGAVLLACIYLPTNAATMSNSNILDGRILLDARVWPRMLTVSLTAGSNYTAKHNEVVIISGGLAGALSTVTLPTPAVDLIVTVKTAKGTADGSSFTISPSGGATIDGQTSWKLTMAYDSITVICDGTNWWVI